MNVECFAVKHRELLELEKSAEIEETQSLHNEVPSKHLEKLGLCIRKLQASEKRSGLYGRTMVKFQPQWTGMELPSHKIFSGDIVGVGSSNDFGHRDVLMSGVVWRVNTAAIMVAFEEDVDAFALDDHTCYCLVKLANNVTYRRLKSVLMDLQKYKGGCASHLIDVLFGTCSPSSPILSLPSSIFCADTGTIRFRNTALNTSQKEAVKFALCQREIAIIHGPPGTGKSTTLVEIICQIAAQGLKLLVCAPSNVAVDNLVEKLFANGLKVVRLGHPARAMPTNQDLSLDAALFASDNAILVGDIRKEMDAILVKVDKTKDKYMKHKLRMESKELSHELRRREKAAITEVLQRADVVASTLTSCYTDGPLKHLAKDHFDYVVIDEVSQAIEAACWIPLLRGSKCVIAGDHLQLPPTIISKAAAKGGMAITLMERLMGFAGSSGFVKMLETQYRMHEAIMRWSSDKLYGGKLVAHPSVAAHLLRDMAKVDENEDTSVPLLLIDTTGCDMPELECDDEVSKGNEGEAKLVCCHVQKLIESGVSATDIAVITPYNLQVHLLRGMLSAAHPTLEIKSVDGFQGREKEVVVMSLVRSNERREVGFLAEDRRINVAVTRARRHLAVVCDSETVSNHLFLKEFVDYLSERGEVRSAHQYHGELATCIAMVPVQTRQAKPQPTKLTTKVHSESKQKTDSNFKSNSKQPPEIRANSTTTNTTSPQEIDQIRARFSAVLHKFVSDQQVSEHQFPAALTALERKIVHEICEQLGLAHRSHGEKDCRRIVVTKKASAGGNCEANDASVAGRKETNRSIGSTEELTKTAKQKKATEKKNKDVSVAGTNSADSKGKNDCHLQKTTSGVTKSDTDHSELKKVTDKKVKDDEKTEKVSKPTEEKENRRSTKKESRVPKTESKASLINGASLITTQPKKPKDKSKPDKDAQRPDEDDDAFEARLLGDAVKRNKVCNYPRCKTSTVLLRQVCDYCNHGFCLSHHIPEAHGCGDAARAVARARIAKEGSLVPGSGKVSRKPDPTHRVHLERKLDKKIGELAGQRSHKAAKKEKQK